jgi:hypothetical protein
VETHGGVSSGESGAASTGHNWIMSFPYKARLTKTMTNVLIAVN